MPLVLAQKEDAMFKIIVTIVTTSFFIGSYAWADAFIPTMLSANILWILALPIVVMIEGWFMAKRQWHSPYRTALIGNILSMIAALPFGVLLSLLGDVVAKSQFLPDTLRNVLAQILIYGQLPTPTYGFIGANHYMGMSGVYLAATGFIGLCWAFSILVEGFYYGKKNPSIAKSTVYKVTTQSHLVSYALLLFLWLPYSFYSAKSQELSMRDGLCLWPNAWSATCYQIFDLYPEAKQARLKNCRLRQIEDDDCIGTTHSY
jgi:hypothetical protein